MGLAAFNRMRIRQKEEMKPENIKQEEEAVNAVQIIEEPIEEVVEAEQPEVVEESTEEVSRPRNRRQRNN